MMFTVSRSSLQSSEKKKRYHELKHLNEHLLKQLEIGRQELDKLNMKKAELDEVSCWWMMTVRLELTMVIIYGWLLLLDKILLTGEHATVLHYFCSVASSHSAPDGFFLVFWSLIYINSLNGMR